MEQTAIGGILGGVPDDLVRPRLEPRRARTPQWLVWTSLSLSDLALAGLALLLFIQGHDRAPAAVAATPSHSLAAFVEDQHLAPMLSFDSPEGARVPARYQARIRQGSNERSDALTYGEIGGDGLFFRVAVHAALSAPAAPSLFVELAKQSAELDAAVVRATSPEPYESSRGPIEWANVILSGPGGEHSCLGFRFARGARVELAGLACGAHASPVGPAALGCLIDRLSTTPAGMAAGLGEALNGDPPRPAACRGVAG
jgi:hypothetical protein